MIEIIPAIDLKGGKCVRLSQGRDESAVEYSADPVGIAHHWEEEGARRLHVVNLDGAFGRTSRHLEILRAIARSVSCAIQYGGGLRTEADVEQAFKAGAERAVLGTVAIEQPDLLARCLVRFGPGRILVSLDARKGKVATHGWLSQTESSVVDAARKMKTLGVQQIITTDIARDGMLSGPDMVTIGSLAIFTSGIFISGGISSEDDVRDLVSLRLRALKGVIIGKALYEGKIHLRSLIDQVATW